MKNHLRNHVTSLFLLVPSAAAIVALPVAAFAQPASPEVQSVEVRSDGDLRPGSRLTFRVEGTPRARAVLRIEGVRDRIELREVRRGVYVGRYTVKAADRIERDSSIRAVLRSDNRSGAANHALGEVLTDDRPVAQVPPPPPAPRIERFSLAPIERIEPGAELRFALDGVPGAAVRVDLPGVENNVDLREVRPGRYEGNYTIRRADNLNLSRPMVATLRLGDRAVNAELQFAQPANDNRAPNVVNLSPREGEAIAAGPNVQIAANFEDRGGSGVDPATVRISLSGRDVTPDAQVSPSGFSFRAALGPGRHTVGVIARDRAGNAMRRDWSFDVAAPVAAVPLMISSHANNAQVLGANTTVQGRTAPFANVAVTVSAVAPVPGGVSVSQQIFSQVIQSDATGVFSFNFAPRFPLPGTRYDVAMRASKGDVHSESRLVLHQR